jgi:hypothetical protein
VIKELYPKVVSVELLSEPTGVPLTFDAEVEASPVIGQMIAGGSANVSAPARYVAGEREFEFEEWSDGGDRSHTVSSAEPLRMTATYLQIGGKEGPGDGGGQGPGGSAQTGLRIRSRPAGVPIGVDGGRRKTPFDLALLGDDELRLIAPPGVDRNGRRLRFLRWSDGVARRGRTASSALTFYCAVYGAPRARSRARARSHRH